MDQNSSAVLFLKLAPLLKDFGLQLSLQSRTIKVDLCSEGDLKKYFAYCLVNLGPIYITFGMKPGFAFTCKCHLLTNKII